MRKKSVAKMTRGERVCAFIEGYCIVPEGDKIGKPIKLEPFQRRFVLDVYDNPYGTHSAYLSIARKNGKTGLIAALLLAHIAGPEAVLNSQIRLTLKNVKQLTVVVAIQPDDVPPFAAKKAHVDRK